jgi:hypothetical protein
MTERPEPRKGTYRPPEIVELGGVEAITTAGDSPVRDNPGQNPPDWDNPNPPTQGW